MNWYTKRAALTGIYNTTELVMLQDSSPDFNDTWTFLGNRIQDVVNMASTAKQAKSDLTECFWHSRRNTRVASFALTFFFLSFALQVQSTGEAVVQGVMGAAITVRFALRSVHYALGFYLVLICEVHAFNHVSLYLVFCSWKISQEWIRDDDLTSTSLPLILTMYCHMS